MAASGSGAPHKALLQLNGLPLVRRSVERLFESGALVGAVVVAHHEDVAAMRELLAPLSHAAGPVLAVVEGGATRQASCAAGLAEVGRRLSAEERSTARVLFHDAARPLVTGSEIRAVLAALEECPAALLATPVTQTVKQADAEGRVTATVPRENLRLAQTPQGFRFTDALAAFERAAQAGFEATDDVALAEFCGLAVRIVPGSPWNIKITTPEDLGLAAAILKLQGRA